MKFGEKLVRLRKQKGMSQEDLAARLFVSRQAVSRWENGETVPDAENIVQISKLFQVATDYLLLDETTGDGSEVNEGRKEQALKGSACARIFSLGGLAVASLLLLLGLCLKTTWLWASGLAGQVVFLVFFEAAAVKYHALGNAGAEKRRFYRVAVWLLALFPSVAAAQVFFALYPRPYHVLWLLPFTAAVYMMICLCTVLLLKKKS